MHPDFCKPLPANIEVFQGEHTLARGRGKLRGRRQQVRGGLNPESQAPPEKHDLSIAHCMHQNIRGLVQLQVPHFRSGADVPPPHYEREVELRTALLSRAIRQASTCKE